MKNFSDKKRLLVFSALGGAAAVIAHVAMLFARELAGATPLCPDGLTLGKSLACTYIGVVLPQYLIIAAIALLMYLFLKRYFKYSFFVSFFAIGYASYLSSAISWLHLSLSMTAGILVFYAWLFLLGSLLFFLTYLYFVKAKMWLWLKLFIALVALFPILPMIMLYVGRVLY